MTTKKATVDSSSIESRDKAGLIFSTRKADLTFRLDVERFPSSGYVVGHQLMLTVTDENPCIEESDIEVKHLVDLGVLKFKEQPTPDEDAVQRNEKGQQLWVSTESLRQVWDCLTKELARYEGIWLEPPHVNKKRHIQISITDMNYFNDFVSPNIERVPATYLSHDKKRGVKNLQEPPLPLTFFL